MHLSCVETIQRVPETLVTAWARLAYNVYSAQRRCVQALHAAEQTKASVRLVHIVDSAVVE